MKKIIFRQNNQLISLIAVLIIALFSIGTFISSCSEHNNFEEEILIESRNSFPSETVCSTIVTSNEALTYFDLRRDFINILFDAIDRGIDKDTLKDLSLAASTDTLKMKELIDSLFSTRNEGIVFFDSIYSSLNSFVSEYPIVDSLGQLYSIDIEESIDELFDNFNGIYRSYGATAIHSSVTGGGFSSHVDDIVCGSYANQLRLAACAAGCGLISGGIPAVAAMCGWACWCTFCTENSVTADVICAD